MDAEIECIMLANLTGCFRNSHIHLAPPWINGQLTFSIDSGFDWSGTPMGMTLSLVVREGTFGPIWQIQIVANSVASP